jgi:succinate dehydrogenase flavin-adding protein (antitoxin of CptAB toxin-antitoxin module)
VYANEDAEKLRSRLLYQSRFDLPSFTQWLNSFRKRGIKENDIIFGFAESDCVNQPIIVSYLCPNR